MSVATLVQLSPVEERPVRLRIAAVLNVSVFAALLLLLIGSAVPYGTAEPWWKATFVSAVFAICIVAIIESMLSGENRIGGSRSVLLSMLVLSVLALLQTITIRSGNPANPYRPVARQLKYAPARNANLATRRL